MRVIWHFGENHTGHYVTEHSGEKRGTCEPFDPKHTQILKRNLVHTLKTVNEHTVRLPKIRSCTHISSSVCTYSQRVCSSWYPLGAECVGEGKSDDDSGSTLLLYTKHLRRLEVTPDVALFSNKHLFYLHQVPDGCIWPHQHNQTVSCDSTVATLCINLISRS